MSFLRSQQVQKVPLKLAATALSLLAATALSQLVPIVPVLLTRLMQLLAPLRYQPQFNKNRLSRSQL